MFTGTCKIPDEQVIGEIRTMASGNCKSMKREIEGKISSGVRGESEVRAATAKELNATSTIDDINYLT